MKKIVIKFMCLVLSLAMVLTMVPMVAFASNDIHSVTISGGEHGILKKDGVLVDGNSATISVADGETVPSNYTVTPKDGFSINKYNFTNNSKIKQMYDGLFSLFYQQNNSSLSHVSNIKDKSIFVSSPFPKGVQSTCVSPSVNGTAFIGNDENVYVDENLYSSMGHGEESNKFVKLEFIRGVKPISVSAGYRHLIVLGDNGKVYCLGNNSNGQFGNGTTKDSSTFVEMKLPEGRKATAVYSDGANHSVVLCDDNKIYGCGNNRWGQLGDGTKNDALMLQEIKLPEGVSPKEVDSNVISISVLGTDGNVYMSGCKVFDFFSANPVQGDAFLTMTKIDLPNGVKAEKMASCDGETLVIGNDGKLYGKGCNKYYSLGNKNQINYDSFIEIPVQDNIQISSICANLCNSLICDTNGNWYYCGVIPETWGVQVDDEYDHNNVDYDKVCSAEFKKFDVTNQCAYNMSDIVICSDINITPSYINVPKISLEISTDKKDFEYEGEVQITVTATISNIDKLDNNYIEIEGSSDKVSNLFFYSGYTDEKGKLTVTKTVSSSPNYNIVANYKGDINNTKVESKKEYKLNKLTLSPSEFNFIPPSNLTYDCNKKVAKVSRNNVKYSDEIGAIKLKYYDDNNNKLTDLPSEVGTYTVKIDVAEGKYFNSATDLTDKSWKFTIAPVMRTIKFVDYQDNEISSKEYADGTKASDVEVPKNSSNYHDKSTHTLFSWEKVNDVSADATYKEVKTTENHFWDAGKVTKNATTRNAGSKLFTCKVCGETKTETIPKLNAKSQTISTEFSSKTVGVSSVGKTTKINAKAKTKLTYKSSNTKFATVNSKGVVTYKGQGTATITITAASTPDYKGCKKTVKVTVKRYLFKYKALYDSNYRTGAGTNYRVVDSVKKGSTVYLLEKSEKKGTNGKTWAKIKVGNKYYWIQKNLLKRA